MASIPSVPDVLKELNRYIPAVLSDIVLSYDDIVSEERKGVFESIERLSFPDTCDYPTSYCSRTKQALLAINNNPGPWIRTYFCVHCISEAFKMYHQKLGTEKFSATIIYSKLEYYKYRKGVKYSAVHDDQYLGDFEFDTTLEAINSIEELINENF